MTDGASPKPGANPPPLVVAASLVAIQGVVLLALAAVDVASAADERRSLAWSTAAFLAAYGVVLLAAAGALARRRHWARGPVLLTQLIALGVAWNVRDQVVLAVVLAVTAAIAIAAMVHPDSIDALEGRDRSDDQSADSND